MYTEVSTTLATVNEAAKDFSSAGDKSIFECSADDVSSIMYCIQPQLPLSLSEAGLSSALQDGSYGTCSSDFLLID